MRPSTPPSKASSSATRLSRGKPVVEALLDSGRAYSSGPQWLAEHVLRDKWVLAVSGTHGKTTTTSMLAWILEYAGLEARLPVGGVPSNFGISARLGGSKYFVVEADEYDTAFFDKRAKFVHYRPRTLIVNNIEYDHADIYSRTSTRSSGSSTNCCAPCPATGSSSPTARTRTSSGSLRAASGRRS